MGGHYILKINNKCNMNCLFCADSAEIRSQPDPALNDIIQGLEENSHYFDSLIITGGEPTIYENILYVVRYAKKLGYRWISIATNGLLLADKNVVNKLKRAGVDSIQVSYFADDDQTFKALSRTSIDYNLVNKAIINSLDMGLTVRINIVINNLNYKKLTAMVQKLVSYGVYHINLAFMNPVGTSVINGRSITALPFSEIMPRVKESIKRTREVGFENLTIENFPLCIAGEYREILSDLTKPQENEDYYNSAKTKPEKCQQCVCYEDCSGVWKAHLKQFGSGEIKPLELPEKEQRAIYDTLFNQYNFEISGINAGVKPASIFPLSFSKIYKYKQVLEKHGYSCSISSFSYNISDEKTKKNGYGCFSLYVSKDKETCNYLKELDYYHQKIAFHPNLKLKEVYKKIGELLGYPGCCSEFLWGRDKNAEFGQFSRLSDGEYEDETIYPLMALKRSQKVHHELNNFSINNPKLIHFFVCSYECENALAVARTLLNYIKDNFPQQYYYYIKELKKSILFFSAQRIIRFNNVYKKERIYYDEFTYDQDLLSDLSREKVNKFLKIIKTLKQGNSFEIDNSYIDVYCNGKFIERIEKKHKYDGVLVEYE